MPAHETPTKPARSTWYVQAMEELLSVIQELSQARDFDAIRGIVRRAARKLTGADGATIVLRDGDKCYYVDEDAIAPLWKGLRFPMATCISGWSMLHAQPAVIEDIYADPRIPADAYRPTFVKSLAMVPIRRTQPIGAIGNYWAERRLPTGEETAILQALADATSVAIENARLFGELESSVHALEASNAELGRFAWVVSHDLQEPLRTVVTQLQLLERRCADGLGEIGLKHAGRALSGAQRLQQLVQDVLVHAQLRAADAAVPVALGGVVDDACAALESLVTAHGAEIVHDDLPEVHGDRTQLLRLFQNLIANAITFHKPGVAPRVEVRASRRDGRWQITVRDNGIGIDACDHQGIFELFHRLHPRDTYPGSGIGLATCRKIVTEHGGEIWVESQLDQGSAFHCTLPAVHADERAASAG